MKETFKNILQDIGSFSETDFFLFEEQAKIKTVDKGELLLNTGEICKSVFYLISGSCYVFKSPDIDEEIVDLHLAKEWVFDQASLTSQIRSQVAIKTFEKSEILEMSLESTHKLIAKSPAFLQLNKIFSRQLERTYMFDSRLTPAEKYHYITVAKPFIAKVFPVKMIASYLKIAPETLSRVRTSN